MTKNIPPKLPTKKPEAPKTKAAKPKDVKYYGKPQYDPRYL